MSIFMLLTKRNTSFAVAQGVALVFVAALPLAHADPDALAEQPTMSVSIDVGSQKQLFIDQKFISSSRGVSLEINPARKMGPVIRSEHPWEKEWCGGWLSVIEDEGLYKMWYRAQSKDYEGMLCYATSTDGVSWQKPELNLVQFEGSRANNIVLEVPFESGAVYKDPVAPAESRFKLLTYLTVLGKTDYEGMVLVTSPDGLNWKEEYPVLPRCSDMLNQLFWDERIGKYVAYLRGYPPKRWERTAVRCEIPKEDIFKIWPHTPTEGRFVIGVGSRFHRVSTENLPQVIARDERDPADCSVYYPCVHRYPWAEDVYLAFPCFFYHTDPGEVERQTQDDIVMSGILETQLAVSRDGIDWQRLDRRPYVPLGLPGDTDSKGTYMGVGMLRRGAQIYMYYTGFASPHEDPHYEDNALMLAVQRLDGFVSASAPPEGGEFTTPLLTFTGNRLHLNVQTSILGEVRVEILDAAGRTIPGFSRRDCDPIVTNEVDRVVTWQGEADVSQLRGEAVRMRFLMRNAKLYAFQFKDS